ncbi:helix-turn-helix domain-containing protein [Amycolatopsis tolypomycina]|nr:helix-turn-helix transcriptional regulator [Amycolatopsis tolypomycina]
MVSSPRRIAGTPKARTFGSAVREAREALEKKPSLRAVAAQLGMDPSRLSKIETGKAVPSAEVAERILDHLGMTGDHKAEVLALLEGAETEQPWYANTLPEQRQHTTMIVEAEDAAREIFAYTIGVVPGLLQTKRYARAIMVGGGDPLPPSEVTIRVMTRMGRQGVLSPEREHPVNLIALIALIHETALRQMIGGRVVMVEQLEFLLKIMRRDNIDVRIVPNGLDWHEGLEGSFSLISPREDTDLYPLVFLENRRSGQILHADEDVAAYRDAVDSLLRLAMTSAATEEAIAGAITALKAPQ